MSKNIILIGPMGSGKTSVGKRLSEKLDREFFDTDNEIVKNTGVSIGHIFDIEGESGFRKRETKVLSELVALENIVIATGGGIIIKEENRNLLKAGMVVYLESDIKTLVKRCSVSKARPLINQSTNPEEVLIDIMTKREHLYKQTANYIINTVGKNINLLVKEISDLI